jgi:hypothetical protein
MLRHIECREWIACGASQGDGLGLVDVCSECGLVGRPRLIGTISGTACCVWAGGALKAPTIGGEATVISGEGRCWLARLSTLISQYRSSEHKKPLTNVTETYIFDWDFGAAHETHLAHNDRYWVEAADFRVAWMLSESV